MTDPIWDFSSQRDGPIFLKRLSGEVHRIDPGMQDEPDDADLKPEEELRITEVTAAGRSELRSEIEAAFSGPEWPPPHAIIQAFRRYAVKVLDVNAEAYGEVILRQKRDAKVALSAMVRNLLAGLFGREWENSPGERVIRIRWQEGPDGWKGEEISVIAGNDPDPTCLYHQLMGDAIKLRYRFHDPPPAHVPGEHSGLGVTNLEWWKYIGLKERHDQAMVLQPYLEDRIAHWQAVYAVRLPKVAVSAPSMKVGTVSKGAESSADAANTPDPFAGFDSTENRSRAVAAYTGLWMCPEASLARTANVDPADLAKWKTGKLPRGSEKKARIEKALRNNEPATPLANHPKNS